MKSIHDPIETIFSRIVAETRSYKSVKRSSQSDLSIESYGPKQSEPRKPEIKTLKSLARSAPLYREAYISVLPNTTRGPCYGSMLQTNL